MPFSITLGAERQGREKRSEGERYSFLFSIILNGLRILCNAHSVLAPSAAAGGRGLRDLSAVRDDDLPRGRPALRSEALDLLHDIHALGHGAELG